jgi:hypothetical protein
VERVLTLLGDTLLERLHAETISDLIEAEIAWFHIGKNLDTWPVAKPRRRRGCVCCALERELRTNVRQRSNGWV